MSIAETLKRLLESLGSLSWQRGKATPGAPGADGTPRRSHGVLKSPTEGDDADLPDTKHDEEHGTESS